MFSKNLLFLISSLLLMMFFKYANLGGAGSVGETYLVPQLLAMPLVLLIFVSSLLGKYQITLLSLILSVFIQPSLALLTLVSSVGNFLFNPKISKKVVKALFLFVLTFLLLLALYPNNTNVTVNREFQFILAWFRHPHHYIPSTFPVTHFIEFLGMVFFLTIALLYLYKYFENKLIVKLYFVSLVIALTLLIIGYIFVEIFPVRQVIEIQTYRIVYLVRWMFITLLPASTYIFLSRNLKPRLVRMLYLFLITLLILKYSTSPSNSFTPLLQMRTPHEKSDLYNFVYNFTPNDALFLTPPNFGDMRISAKRAVVVDYKSFPFNVDETIAWYHRIIDCYGNSNYENNYKNMDDKKLDYLKEIYNFDYVILDSTTNTKHDFVYRDKYYGVIKL